MGLVVVANRQPLRLHRGEWVAAVGGLATALLPLLQERRGVWVASAEGSPGEAPPAAPPAKPPPFQVRRVVLPEATMAGYYHGMSNRVLWPLSHYFIERVDLRREFFEAYRRTNEQFARLVLKEWQGDDPVWVHDYHLMLVPQMLRQARPEGRIGFFWHIPWPAVEVWRVLPWARTLLKGVLGADRIGLHIEDYVVNFLDACRVLLGARVEGHTVYWEGRRIQVEAHPIGIDTQAFQRFAEEPAVRKLAARLRQHAAAQSVVLGVERLDYTKGVLERLLAFERFLDAYPHYRGRVCLYQIAVPSRTRVESYRMLKRAVDEVVGRINGAYTTDRWVPVRYLYRSFPQRELAAFYRAADVALVTPLRDGMNLVAQEFVAVSNNGALILSELAGAASVLPEAIQVNPYDIEGMAHALREALEMGAAERQAALASMKERVHALDVRRWGQRFLEGLQSR